MHPFQHDVGLIVGYTRIKQSRNIWMVQPGEHIAFAREPCGQRVCGQIATQKFDGGGALEHAVATHGAPHLTHAALTDFFGERPAAKFEPRVIWCLPQRSLGERIVQQ